MKVYACTVQPMACCGHSFFAHNWTEKAGGVLYDDCPKEKQRHTPGPMKEKKHDH